MLKQGNSMALRVINNETSPSPGHGVWDAKQDEHKQFSKICYIPSLGLSCFGCCGHHFQNKEVMEKFFDNNSATLKKYLGEGKTYTDFMNREYLVDSCGGCYSLIREKDEKGKDQYACAVHPLRIGGKDIRVGYCEHDYLCKTAAHVNKMTHEEKDLFYEFLKAQKFDSFTYSIINADEVVLLAMYRAWKEQKRK